MNSLSNIPNKNVALIDTGSVPEWIAKTLKIDKQSDLFILAVACKKESSREAWVEDYLCQWVYLHKVGSPYHLTGSSIKKSLFADKHAEHIFLSKIKKWKRVK